MNKNILAQLSGGKEVGPFNLALLDPRLTVDISTTLFTLLALTKTPPPAPKMCV